jgi:hypothetical protein
MTFLAGVYGPFKTSLSSKLRKDVMDFKKAMLPLAETINVTNHVTPEAEQTQNSIPGNIPIFGTLS